MAQNDKKLTEEQKKIRQKVLDQVEQEIMSLPSSAFPKKGDDEAMAVELGIGKVGEDKMDDLKEMAENKAEGDDKKRKRKKSSGNNSEDDSGDKKLDAEDFKQFLEKKKKQKNSNKNSNSY